MEMVDKLKEVTIDVAKVKSLSIALKAFWATLPVERQQDRSLARHYYGLLAALEIEERRR